MLSGRQDSNLRPPGPKPGAITNYATPRTAIKELKCGCKCTIIFYSTNNFVKAIALYLTSTT